MPNDYKAIEAIDSGNITLLENLLAKHPDLLRRRFDEPAEGYFKHPYLLWFVADNPIRIDRLPPNILAVTRLLIEAVKRKAPDTLREQLDYTLGLVATGRIPRECGVQLEMMDLLIDAGAEPGSGVGALAHGNVDAATHLIKRGGKLTLATAVGLDRLEDAALLAPLASAQEQLTACAVAGFYGNQRMIRFLLGLGVDPNGYPDDNSGFHTHATPLHQAVYSGSLESVKLLVEAGAKLDAADKIYSGTPLGWAKHMQTDNAGEAAKTNFALIEAYLVEREQA